MSDQPARRFSLSNPFVPKGPLPESVAWGAVNTLISGLIAFGLPGWLLDRKLGTDWIVLVGLLLGMAVALTVIWFRYGTDRSQTDPAASSALKGPASTSSDHAGPADLAHRPHLHPEDTQ
jgi:thiol:disulfide interchange protein